MSGYKDDFFVFHAAVSCFNPGDDRVLKEMVVELGDGSVELGTVRLFEQLRGRFYIRQGSMR